MAEDEIVSVSSSVDMGLSKLRETEADREAWRAAARGVAETETRLTHDCKVSRCSACVLDRGPNQSVSSHLCSRLLSICGRASWFMIRI